MKEINDFLLNLFTCVDKLRPRLASPNLKDGIVYASDGHVLIAIPDSELSLNYPTNEKYPSADKLLKEAILNCTESISVQISDVVKELVRARIKVDSDFINCKDCEGSGEVEWEYTSKNGYTHTIEEECPVCHGEGGSDEVHPFARVSLSEIECDSGEYGINIGVLYYHPFQLYRLFMVALMKGVKTIDIFYNPNNYGQTLTYFGETKVLVMAKIKN